MELDRVLTSRTPGVEFETVVVPTVVMAMGTPEEVTGMLLYETISIGKVAVVIAVPLMSLISIGNVPIELDARATPFIY